MTPEICRLLTALGYGPEYTAESFPDPVRGRGLQVYRRGEPVKLLLAKQLINMRGDDEFLRRWVEAA